MQFRILAVGRIKGDYLQEGIAHYLKRLKPYARVEILEIPEGKASRKNEKQSLQELLADEGERLSRLTAPGSFSLALDERGKYFSSVQFASFLSGLAREGRMPVNFIIGGAKGLDKKVLENSHQALSLSPMTFPHQLVRLIILEQLYRCCKIIKNEPYHY